MNFPDYVSPVVGYRAWLLDPRGLTSLNGEIWHPNQKLQAVCRRSVIRHAPPHGNCSCGIYAAKSLDQLREIGYAEQGVRGEVYLWGTVVEHELGWRAQFAYPKTLVVGPELVLRDLCTVEMESLKILIGYGADLFVAGEKGTVPLWTKQCRGLDRRELTARLWQSHHSERLERFAAAEAQAKEIYGTHLRLIRIVMVVDENVIPADVVTKMFMGKLPVKPIVIPVPPGRSMDDVVNVYESRLDNGGSVYTEYRLNVEQAAYLCTSLRAHWQPVAAPLPKGQWSRRSTCAKNCVLTIAIAGWTGHESSFWHLTHCHPKIATMRACQQDVTAPH